MPINYALREELERQIDEHNQRKKKRNFIVPKIGGSPPPPTPPEADYFFQTPYSAKQSAQLQPQSQAAPQMKQQQPPPPQHQQQAAQAPLQHPQPQWSPQQELTPPVHHYYQHQPQPQPVRQMFAYPSLPVGGAAPPAGPDPTFVPYHPQPQSSNLPPPPAFPGAPAATSSSSHAVVRSAPSPTPHDFFHLDSKWEEQQRKKEQDRKKAEELRQALEEQIALKNQLLKRRRDAELREARDAEDAFKRRADEEARRRAEHAQQQAKAFADLQEQNRSLAQNHQVAAPPTITTGKAAELPPRELRSPSPSLFPPTADGPLSPLSADPIRADTVVVSPAPHSTSTADLREVLSRIHTELMQQRQMVMSPSGYSMGLAVPPPRLPPLSFKPAAPPSLVPSMRDEMVTDTAFVGRKDDVFSMTSVQSGMSPPRLPRSNVFEINACLKKNHDRLQRLQFARNADDVLKVFLSHDAPLGATRSNFDLQPPSSMLS